LSQCYTVGAIIGETADIALIAAQPAADLRGVVERDRQEEPGVGRS
jgi:hypothetical protein